MKVPKMFFVVSITLLLASSAAVAGDFDWARVRARNDGEGIFLNSFYREGKTWGRIPVKYKQQRLTPVR